MFLPLHWDEHVMEAYAKDCIKQVPSQKELKMWSHFSEVSLYVYLVLIS